tara:strand:+ start:1334 stop:2059 length:726 start_codon:yes stop_codon:yes gene_type:complete
MKFEYDPKGITIIDNALPEKTHLNMWQYFSSPMFLWQWGGVVHDTECLDADGNSVYKVVQEVPHVYNKQMCRVLYRHDREIFRDDLYFTFKKDMKPSDGFISMATENALCLKQLQPLLSNLGIRRDQLNRIKMNNTTPKSENIFTGYHIDCRPEWKGNGMTAIYYFNTTDGPTRFFGHDDVECVANRLVIFPNDQRHGGTFHTNKQSRIVVNINWLHEGWVEPESNNFKYIDHVPDPESPY